MEIPPLWDIQTDSRIKLSVVGLLALGIFASIVGIIRFTTIVRSTPAIATGIDYLYILNPIMTWAHAEPAMGMIAANSPALRPLLEKALSFFSNLTLCVRSDIYLASGPSSNMELGAMRNDIDRGKGKETRIMEGYAGDDARPSLSDVESQRRIVRPEQGNRMKKSYGVRTGTR